MYPNLSNWHKLFCAIYIQHYFSLPEFPFLFLLGASHDFKQNSSHDFTMEVASHDFIFIGDSHDLWVGFLPVHKSCEANMIYGQY